MSYDVEYMSAFYANAHPLLATIRDLSRSPYDIIREVERLCDWDAHASQYYRTHPELLFDTHPWVTFVRRGAATHLGWEQDE